MLHATGKFLHLNKNLSETQTKRHKLLPPMKVSYRRLHFYHRTLTQNSLSLVQLPLPPRPQSDCEFLDDNVEKDAAEEDVPAVAGQHGAH